MKKSFVIASIILSAICISFSAARFTDNGDGTVNDGKTGLLWQQCSNGLSGTGCSTGTATTMIWVAAISYCENLSLGGRTDWRLPNINELRSIVDVGKYNPAINTTFFPVTKSLNYWSSNSYAGNPGLAKNVNFSDGTVLSNITKATAYYVRCVSGP